MIFLMTGMHYSSQPRLRRDGPDTGHVGDARDPQLPRPSPRLGLDIDLSGPSAASQPSVPLSSDTDSNATTARVTIRYFVILYSFTF